MTPKIPSSLQNELHSKSFKALESGFYSMAAKRGQVHLSMALARAVLLISVQVFASNYAAVLVTLAVSSIRL